MFLLRLICLASIAAPLRSPLARQFPASGSAGQGLGHYALDILDVPNGPLVEHQVRAVLPRDFAVVPRDPAADFGITL